MAVQITHRLDVAAINRLLRSPGGAVAKDALRRGYRVEAAAKRLCPVDQGRLRSSISTELRTGPTGLFVQVGTDVEYAMFVHEGTGIYGPRGAVIRPKRGRYLVFTPKGGGETVFARSVRGAPGVPFLRNALPAARG